MGEDKGRLGNVMKEFDPISIWPAIVRAYQAVRGEAEQALKPFDIASLEEYDVLLELRRARKPLTLTEIEEHTLLKQYQLSRLVDRLVQKGLVVRNVSSNDARARLVSLTAQGREVQKNAGQAYLDVLKGRLVARIDTVQARTARSVLKTIGDNER